MSRRLAVQIVIAVSFLVSALPAQERRPASGPEADIMAYFASAMAFTPVGLSGAAGRWEFGGSLSLIPNLPDEDRAVGFGGTKYENTNLCPVFPRLTAAGKFGAFAIEAGWTPPLEVCGVQANIAAAALSWRRDFRGSWSGLVRGSVLAGALEAAITCSEDAVANSADQTCFGGTVSNDRMAPLSLSIEAGMAYRGWQSRRLEPYFLAGLSSHRVDFDVNYERLTAGATVPALVDHEKFRATVARLHLAAGASWAPAPPLTLGGELYLSPGSLLTLRGRAAIAFGGFGAR